MKSDVIRLRHIVDAATEAVAFAAGKSRVDLDTDRMLALSLVQLMSIVGEAAGSVSDGCRHTHPDVPWAQMTAMRNRLVHAYWDIKLNYVWDTVTADLPPLIAQVREILAAEDSSPG